MKFSDLYFTDKDKYITDKFIYHGYAAVYDELFGRVRNDELNIAEMGIYLGGFIRLLHDYLPLSNIYGIDKNPRTSQYPDYPRIKINTGDGYDLKTWSGLPKMDIIIDDGSHAANDQLWMLRNSANLLVPGGLMIIEDVKSRNFDKIKSFSNKLKVYDYHISRNLSDDIIVIHEC